MGAATGSVAAGTLALVDKTSPEKLLAAVFLGAVIGGATGFLSAAAATLVPGTTSLSAIAKIISIVGRPVLSAATAADAAYFGTAAILKLDDHVPDNLRKYFAIGGVFGFVLAAGVAGLLSLLSGGGGEQPDATQQQLNTSPVTQ